MTGPIQPEASKLRARGVTHTQGADSATDHSNNPKRAEISLTGSADRIFITDHEKGCFLNLREQIDSLGTTRMFGAGQKFIDSYVTLPWDSSLRDLVAKVAVEKGLQLQIAIVGACLERIDHTMPHLCDLAARMVAHDAAGSDSKLILRHITYCLGHVDARYESSETRENDNLVRRVYSAAEQLSSFIDALDRKGILETTRALPARRDWSGLLERLRVADVLPEPIAQSLYRILVRGCEDPLSIKSAVDILENAPASFFSYSPAPGAPSVAARALKFLAACTTLPDARHYSKIIKRSSATFYNECPGQQNPFSAALSDFVKELIDRGRTESKSTTKPDVKERLLKMALSASVTLAERGESGPFHLLCEEFGRSSSGLGRLVLLAAKNLHLYPEGELRFLAAAERIKGRATRGVRTGSEVARCKATLEEVDTNFSSTDKRAFVDGPLMRLVVGSGRWNQFAGRMGWVVSKEDDPEILDRALKLVTENSRKIWLSNTIQRASAPRK